MFVYDTLSSLSSHGNCLFATLVPSLISPEASSESQNIIGRSNIITKLLLCITKKPTKNLKKSQNFSRNEQVKKIKMTIHREQALQSSFTAHHTLALTCSCVWPVLSLPSRSNLQCSPHHRSSDWVSVRPCWRRTEEQLNSNPSWQQQQQQHRCALNISSRHETSQRHGWAIYEP